jgi:hypothetical protein
MHIWIIRWQEVSINCIIHEPFQPWSRIVQHLVLGRHKDSSEGPRDMGAHAQSICFKKVFFIIVDKNLIKILHAIIYKILLRREEHFDRRLRYKESWSRLKHNAL